MKRRDGTAAAGHVKVHFLTCQTSDERRVRHLVMIIIITLFVIRDDNIDAINTKINYDVTTTRLNCVGKEIEAVDGASEGRLVVEVTADVRLCGVKQNGAPRIVINAELMVGGETNLWGCWSLFCKKITKFKLSLNA